MSESNQPMFGTKEAFLHNDPLIAWLTTLKDTPKYAGLEILLTSTQRTLDELATRLATIGSSTVPLRNLPEAIKASQFLETISILCGYDAFKYQPMAWMADIWNTSNFENTKFERLIRASSEPVSLAGSINDIFERVFSQALQDQLIVSHQPHVEYDFKRPYLGSGAADLDAHVRGLTVDSTGEESPFYAWIVPVLQSSGTGKTRTVIQLSRIRLGILVCVRPLARQPTLMPPRDDIVANILVDTANTVFEDTRIIATWLIALAQKLLAFYQEDYENFCNEIDGDVDAAAWS